MKQKAIRAGASLTPWSRGMVGAGAIAVALWALAPVALAVESKLTKEDEACLRCHDHEVGKERLRRKLGDGKTLSLDISSRDFIESMHNGTSCEDCHDSLDGKTHGKVKTALGSRRELSESMQPSCVTCHKKRSSSTTTASMRPRSSRAATRPRCARTATRRTPCAR
ncbi:MAG: cytochrome c3 family protein [Ideonella sp.]|nr:cytochrome c3 family protein [Ideonella sp.]